MVAAIRPSTTMSLVISGICSLSPHAGRGWRSRVRGGRSLADTRLQPGVHRVVPEQAVLRLQHPVVLVGEIQVLRLDALALQRSERGDALLHRDAEILLA